MPQRDPHDGHRPVLSIVIKAFNEDARIGAAVGSAKRIAEALDGEVIVADCASMDETAAVASASGATVVRLADPALRSCGIGAEIGFRHSRGEFLWLLDGDMVADPGFAGAALAVLRAHTNIAGVGGRIVEQDVRNFEFERRAAEKSGGASGAAEALWLNGGGIYRRSVIETLGYCTDPNLHSYEEYDLGARLRSAGLRLVRLPIVASRHFGHPDDSWTLLRKRWRSRYAFGAGEAARAAWSQRRMLKMLLEVREARLWIMLTIALMAGVSTAVAGLWRPWMLLIPSSLALALLVAAAARARSVPHALHRLASWAVFTAGFVAGFISARRPPTDPIPCEWLNGTYEGQAN